MTVPTFPPRATVVALRRTLPPSDYIVTHLAIDGASVGYFEDHDAALSFVSPTAKLPGWWPAASSPSQALIDVIPMARIDAIGQRYPKPFATGAR